MRGKRGEPHVRRDVTVEEPFFSQQEDSGFPPAAVEVFRYVEQLPLRPADGKVGVK
jgi:hypothetical protein